MKIYVVVAENAETGEKHVVEEAVFFSEKSGRAAMELAFKALEGKCKIDLHMFEV